jgi:hypothetical protein
MPTHSMTSATISAAATPAALPARRWLRTRDGLFAEIFTWWLLLAAIAALALLLGADPAGAQQTGPLPAATPSDQPPPPPPSTAPKLIGGKPDLSGTWAMNKDDSDDPRQAMREAAGNSGGGNANGGNGGAGPRIGMGGGGGGMGGGGWGGRGGGGNGGGNRGGQNVENPAGDLSQLTIYQTATSATVTNDAGRVIAQYTSGATPSSGPTMKNSTPGASSNSTSPSAPSAGSASSSSSSSATDPGSSNNSGSANSAPNAQWKGSQFVAVTPGRRQGSTKRTFELSPDGKQLYVTTQIDNPRLQSPVTFRLVYDPVQSAE